MVNAWSALQVSYYVYVIITYIAIVVIVSCVCVIIVYVPVYSYCIAWADKEHNSSVTAIMCQ